jgi:hypothetical protein
VTALLEPTVLPASRPGLRGRFAAHCRRSLPPLIATLVGTFGWTLVVTSGALAGIVMRGWETPERIISVAVLYAVGAAIAFPVALFLARFVSYRRPAEAAFAAMFLALALSTVGITALIFAFDYRSYYAEWHEDFGTITWVFQLVFTTAAAVIQFAVLGVRLFFPAGFVALFVASLWFARSAR